MQQMKIGENLLGGQSQYPSVYLLRKAKWLYPQSLSDYTIA